MSRVIYHHQRGVRTYKSHIGTVFFITLFALEAFIFWDLFFNYGRFTLDLLIYISERMR